MQSLDRHILRNYVFLHALQNQLALPIGTQGAEVLDIESDVDADSETADQLAFDESAELPDEALPADPGATVPTITDTTGYAQRAAAIYATYAGPLKSRFKWLRPALFQSELQRDLQADADALLAIVQAQGPWNPAQDTKLQELIRLLQSLPDEKVLGGDFHQA